MFPHSIFFFHASLTLNTLFAMHTNSNILRLHAHLLEVFPSFFIIMQSILNEMSFAFWS